MYDERRESFSIRDLVLQILFVVLFVFILIWLFPTKEYMKKYIDENHGDTVINSEVDLSQLEVLYNQIFVSNMRQMKDGALGYFTVERMPTKEGAANAKKLTLQQMYDLHLVLTLTDKNGNACDATRSYVEVTKHGEEYRMKVNLSCGSEEDYIIVYIGCYDYCSRDLCEKQTGSSPSKPSTPTPKPDPKPPVTPKTECEYKKVTGGSWGDWGAWTAWSTTQVTGNDRTQVESRNHQVITGYKTEQVQTGTKTETYITGYTTQQVVTGYTTQKVQTGTTTERYQSGTTTEKYISGYTTERYVSGYTTQKVQVGTKQVITGYTTKQVPVQVQAGTTTQYQSSGSGTTIPTSNSSTVYIRTGSTTSQSCSSCATVTVYTWDVYKVVPVYKTEYKTEQVPIYGTEPVYETKQVEVYATRQVPVYATRSVPVYSTRTIPVYTTKQVPVYSTKQVPVYGTKTVPVYGTVQVPVYGTETQYRSRTRDYIGGTTDTKWSTCSPVDVSLTNQGYYQTGKTRNAK